MPILPAFKKILFMYFLEIAKEKLDCSKWLCIHRLVSCLITVHLGVQFVNHCYKVVNRKVMERKNAFFFFFLNFGWVVFLRSDAVYHFKLSEYSSKEFVLEVWVFVILTYFFGWFHFAIFWLPFKSFLCSFFIYRNSTS